MMEAVSLVGHTSGYAEARHEGMHDVVSRARDGDDEAFRQIFVRYGRPIISFIYDMVGERDLAEELAQETFVRAYRSLKGLREESRLSTWLFGIAKNVSRESLRKRQRGEKNIDLDSEHVVELKDSQVGPDARLLSKELNDVIRHALSHLDDDKRIVFTLRVFQQRSYEEIAEITGFSIPKLKTDLHRARVEMRRRMSPYMGVGYEVS